ncbi:hypothetical protein D3C73_1436740 [compost metagenome]
MLHTSCSGMMCISPPTASEGVFRAVESIQMNGSKKAAAVMDRKTNIIPDFQNPLRIFTGANANTFRF